MWPELFSVFGVGVQSYGLSKALALLAGAYLLGRAFPRIGYDKELAYSIAMWATIWGFVGAKVYFLVANSQHLSWHMLGGSGFVWYGGLIGGTIAVITMTRRHDLSLAKVAGAMAAPLSVAYGIGRIGCFLAGDGTYGKPTDLPWGMAFPNGAVPVDVPVHPAQLYEAVGAFLIAGVLWALGRRVGPLTMFGAYLALSGAARLVVEFVRINNPILFGLTEAQVLGIVSMLAGTALIVREALHGPAPVSEDEEPAQAGTEAPIMAASTTSPAA